MSAENAQCPYPTYGALREQAPVFEYVEGDDCFYVVSSYELIMEALKKPEIFSSEQGGGIQRPVPGEMAELIANGPPFEEALLRVDPPQHTRQRLLTRIFTPKRVATMEPAIRRVSDELVDRFAANGEAEFVSEFAVPLPLTVIADGLGLDREDIAKFKRWSDNAVRPLGGMLTREEEIESARSELELREFFRAQLDDRRQSPRADILSELVHAEADGVEPLSDGELLSIAKQFLVAGNETTTNLLASGMLTLLHHREQLRLLASSRQLIPNFVEEILRLESPVQGLFRSVKRDTVLGGVALQAGARVALMYAAGNRDGEQFENPADLDLKRANVRSHLAFGQGPHFCLGAPLARAEATIAFEVLLDRLTDMELAQPEGGAVFPELYSKRT